MCVFMQRLHLGSPRSHLFMCVRPTNGFLSQGKEAAARDTSCLLHPALAPSNPSLDVEKVDLKSAVFPPSSLFYREHHNKMLSSRTLLKRGWQRYFFYQI
jgi:hypothetical protein